MEPTATAAQQHNSTTINRSRCQGLVKIKGTQLEKTVPNLGRGINLSLSGSNKSLEKQEGKLKLTVPRDEKFSSTTTKPYYHSQGEDNISSSLHQVF